MATNNAVNEATAASGKILQGQGIGTASAFSTATYPSTAGTSGKVLISDGTNIVSSTPTFPNASATTNKIIKSDGTNWVASTETYAAPGASGNLMTSNGTNWTSAAAPAAAAVLMATPVTLTSAQVKALNGSPIQILGAGGSGKVYTVICATVKLVYGGTNAFVGTGSNVVIATNAVALTGAVPVAFWALTASSYAYIDFVAVAGTAATTLENQTLVITNSGTQISGNAAGNNTVVVTVYYTLT